MKPRTFHLRLDQDASSNARRLHAYIRTIQPGYQPPPKLKARSAMRATLQRVK